MRKCEWIGDAIGNTPLIKLNSISDETGCHIYGKAECMNPGGSIKDRAALYMILDAEEKGIIQKGGYIVEATAGNTGLGLLLIATKRGYKCLFTCPPSASEEKKRLLRRLGAEVVECSSVPSSDPDHFQNMAKRKAEELGGIYINQFYNEANSLSHYETTGKEIWEQTNGEIDCLILASGTGGTISGCSRYLKEQNENVKVYLLEVEGQTVKLDLNEEGQGVFSLREPEEIQEGPGVLEGIGSSKVYLPLTTARVDGSFRCPDLAAVAMCHYLVKTEGIYLGGSGGMNVAGAYWIAKKLGPGHTIVTFMCDGGERYTSKIYNKSYLEEKSLYIPDEVTLEFIDEVLSTQGVEVTPF